MQRHLVNKLGRAFYDKHFGVSIMKIGCLVLEEKVVKVFTKTAYKNQTMIGGATKCTNLNEDHL